MNYYKEIKDRLIDNEIYDRVKDYSKEKHRVITYFEIGRLLTEAGGKYGDNIFRMKQFYSTFNKEKVSTLSTQLSWSHYTELLPIKDENKLLYYLNLCIK